MTRMIERWFPCAEVSANSDKGWGSGNAERNLFTWFAARPTAQAKAAVICSLLPWPNDEAEQKRLQDLVKKAMTGRYAAWEELRREILKANLDGVSVLDPFSGRGMIPLEAARLGIRSYAIDYSPVAVIASELLTDYPFRDWQHEPHLDRASDGTFARMREDEGARLLDGLEGSASRLLRDVEWVLRDIGTRHAVSMRDFYPAVEGVQPWGYLWAVTIPCQECERRFPVVGSYHLRMPSTRKGRRGNLNEEDPGQSYFIDADPETDSWKVVVHKGLPRQTPTLAAAVKDGKKVKGKSATCPFPTCGHVHPLETHQRLAGEGRGQDALLIVAELDAAVGKSFRLPTAVEFASVSSAESRLKSEPNFSPVLPAVPHEDIPLNNGATIRPSLYGATTYGDLMCDRQSLSFIHLARAFGELTDELQEKGLSEDYVRALMLYAAANAVRQLRYSSRGSWLRARDKGTVEVAGVFVNESTLGFSYDFFETGIGKGPGTWASMTEGTLTVLGGLLAQLRGTSTAVSWNSAAQLQFGPAEFTVVVTDPPYDAMVYYSDSSDYFFVWLKRLLFRVWPEFAITSDPRGIQDKTEEIIVKEHGRAPGEHRDRNHYDKLMSQAFTEMRRVVRNDGLVTIVFGHGEPEVWQRLLGAISGAGLVMTGSWPARTESGGQQGKANIETTLTMACRPAAVKRPIGTKSQVEVEVMQEVKSRIELWERSGLAPTDMLMASAGPAMEVVGRYERVVDIAGEPVDPSEYLVVARRAVQEDARIEIDHHPLDTFDARTRFALWWVQLFRKNETAKSELRWQTLAADLDIASVRDLMAETSKGVRFTDADKSKVKITNEASVIDVALAMAAAWPEGMDAVGKVLADGGREEDPYLWATVSFLSDRLPESDSDAIAWTKIMRNKSGVSAAAKGAAREASAEQGSLDFSSGDFGV